MRTITPEQAVPFVRFVVERMKVYDRKRNGDPAPWTDDVILQSYRFCNAYRELDAVTQWVRKNWSQKYSEHPDYWFSMVIARLINRTQTLAVLDPLPWGAKNAEHFEHTIDTIIQSGRQAFSAAYIVSTNGHSMAKAKYLRTMVLDPMWEARKNLRPEVGSTLRRYHQVLTAQNGLGSFMAAQVIADLKNTPGNPLNLHAMDWYTWAAPGPGSLRGLNRVRGRGPIRTGYRHGEWLPLVNELREYLNVELQRHGWPVICAHDTQNCLCEFDKYERVRLGEGAPKQRYAGG